MRIGRRFSLICPDSSLFDQLRDHPIVLTRAGKSAAILLSPDKYEELISTIELLTAIDEAEQDIRGGRVVEHEKFKESDRLQNR